MKTIWIIIIAYFLLIYDLTLTFTVNNVEYKFKYMGLLWVGLDYWTIKKYKSTDKPMKWISFTSIKTESV